MAYAQPQAWYINAGDGATTGYYAIATYTNKAWTAGQLVRPSSAPALGNERAYVCTVAGASTVEPTWTFTKGALQNATGATFQECTGECALNGDLVNALQWTVSSTPALGRVIYDPTTNSLQICTVSAAGGTGVKPSFSVTPGVVTNDASARWTSLGLASAWGPFAAPHARTVNAGTATWGVAGNDFYLADNSNEVSSATVAINIGSTTSPCRFFSVDRSSITTLKAGASIKSTANSLLAIGIGTVGSLSSYWWGVAFIASGNINSAMVSVGANVANIHRFDNCNFVLDTGTIAGAFISLGTTASGSVGLELNNCTFTFALSSQFLALGGCVVAWRNTPDPCILGAVPTTFLRPTAAAPATLLCEGVDFTALGGNILCANNNSGNNFTFKNCKMHTGVVVSGPTNSMPTINYDLINSDKGGLIYRNERYNLNGTQTTSASVFRSGGAVDGGMPVSHNFSSSTFARPWKPFSALPLVIWNDVVGSSVTLTLYGYMAFGLPVPFNDQFWFDVEYMGSTLTPIASFVSNGLPTQLTAHTVVAVADPISIWNGVVGSSTPFSLSATFTPQQKGYLTIYPKLGAGQTVVIDPKPVLS